MDNTTFQEMIHLLRVSVKTGFKSMDDIQIQAEKTLEQVKNSSDIIQDETELLIKQWLKEVKNARTSYSKVVEEGLHSLEDVFKKKE